MSDAELSALEARWKEKLQSRENQSLSKRRYESWRKDLTRPISAYSSSANCSPCQCVMKRAPTGDVPGGAATYRQVGFARHAAGRRASRSTSLSVVSVSGTPVRTRGSEQRLSSRRKLPLPLRSSNLNAMPYLRALTAYAPSVGGAARRLYRG
jgi:hypothetical protein